MTDYTVETPSLIALVGDWHGDIAWALEAVEFIHEMEADLIISVGDFGFWPRSIEGSIFLRALESKLAEFSMELWWVDGNHEDHDVLNRLPLGANGLRPISHHINHIPRGFRWTWEGNTWMGLGGAVSVDQDTSVEHVDWFPAEKISAEDAAYASRDGEVQVMVTHEGIMGVAELDLRLVQPSMWDPEILVKANANRRLLTEVVEAVKPAYLFHGHHHFSYRGDNGVTQVRGLHCNRSSASENITFVDVTGERCC